MSKAALRDVVIFVCDDVVLLLLRPPLCIGEPALGA